MPSSRDVPVSVNKGMPLVIDHPVHPVSVAIRNLADLIAGRRPGGGGTRHPPPSRPPLA